MEINRAKLAVVSLVLLLCGCCASSLSVVTNQAAQAAQAVSTQEPISSASQKETTVSEFFRVGELPPGYDRAKILAAWKRVPDHDLYRVARDDDFSVPGGNKFTEWGELNGNYGQNYVLIVVNRTRTDSNRFSLVLFIDRSGKRYDIYWPYRDADLSAYTVGRHSGDVYLVESGRFIGDIQWDRKQQKYVCK
jgi:hypothetical protein